MESISTNLWPRRRLLKPHLISVRVSLVKTIGLYGVAWGTSISMAIIHLIFWRRFVRKDLGFRC